MSKKFNKIILRCYFNNGDLLLVRNFIRYIKDNIKGYEYKLKHPNHVKVLADLDIPLFWKPVPVKFDNRGYHIEYGSLLINTQVLAYEGCFFRQFSFTLPTAWHIFNQTLTEVFSTGLPHDLYQFIPTIDYHCGKFKVAPIDEHTNNNRKKVLICNNEFQSEQALRFDFNPIIEKVSNLFPDVDFYISNTINNIERDNVFNVSDILGDCGGCDLNEISYLSTKCDILIGRYSGPHTFCYVKENLTNPSKKFITFSMPSTLYGPDPTKWSNMGVHMYLKENERAKFYNIMDNDDDVRIKKICNIIGK